MGKAAERSEFCKQGENDMQQQKKKPGKQKTKKRAARAVFCILLVFAVLMGAFAISEYTLQKKYTIKPFDGSAGTDRIHFLNVGNSDAILLESAGKFALIDCGEDTDNPRGLPGLELEGYEDYVVDYLNAFCRDENGMIQLEFILGTHAHSDHLGGFDTVLSQDNVKVKKAYIKPYFEDRVIDEEVESWDNLENYRSTMDAIRENGVACVQDLTNLSFSFGSYQITVFNGEEPQAGKKVGENENSLAVLVEKDGYRVMLSGDLNNLDGDEDRLAPQIGKVDVLKLGHHGYKDSSTKRYIDTLQPELAIQTTGNPPNLSVKWNVSIRNRIPIYSCVRHDGIILDLSDTSHVQLYDHVML